jgi:hypothetical protein
MTPKEIELKYEELYARAKKLFDDNDICGFKNNNGKCNRDKCDNNPYCCCAGKSFENYSTKATKDEKGRYHCGYFKEGIGCSVYSLACKLWICSSTILTHEARKELDAIKKEVFKYNFFYTPRGTLEDGIRNNPHEYKRILKIWWGL